MNNIKVKKITKTIYAGNNRCFYTKRKDGWYRLFEANTTLNKSKIMRKGNKVGSNVYFIYENKRKSETEKSESSFKYSEIMDFLNAKTREELSLLRQKLCALRNSDKQYAYADVEIASICTMKAIIKKDYSESFDENGKIQVLSFAGICNRDFNRDIKFYDKILRNEVGHNADLCVFEAISMSN
jgi:hypothetical protein